VSRAKRSGPSGVHRAPRLRVNLPCTDAEAAAMRAAAKADGMTLAAWLVRRAFGQYATPAQPLHK
jgi:hypothetical protein